MNKWTYAQSVFSYNPGNGEVRNKTTGELVSTKEDGYVLVTTKDSDNRQKFLRFRLPYLAYYLHTGKVVSGDKRILHKNFKLDDNRACNLEVIDAVLYKNLYEAFHNIKTWIKVRPHPKDVNSYVVYWRENSAKKKRVIQDIVSAKRFEKALRFKFLKFITTNCIFD